MSGYRKRGGKVWPLAYPLGSRHKVYFPELSNMVAHLYNDDGSFTGKDGLRYVRRSVLVREPKRAMPVSIGDAAQCEGKIHE